MNARQAAGIKEACVFRSEIQLCSTLLDQSGGMCLHLYVLCF